MSRDADSYDSNTVLLVGLEAHLAASIELTLSTWSVGLVDPGELEGHLRGVGVRPVLVVCATALSRLSERALAYPVLAVVAADYVDAVDHHLCDDLIVEPLRPTELRYRVSRLTTRQVRSRYGVVAWRPLTLTVSENPSPAGNSSVVSVCITQTQMVLLTVLGREPGAVVPRELLAAAIGSAIGRSLDMQLSRLRHTVAAASANWPERVDVRCSRGVGYQLVVPGRPGDRQHCG